MIIVERHRIDIYYEEHEQKDVDKKIEQLKKEGYKIVFEAKAKNREQGGYELKRDIIPENLGQ